jgi:prepilin-type N-terminal cleavage/methylation domain-containing protein
MNAPKTEKNRKISQKGFTIIEVVLVLAIAGLIFLMVFIALPALQRNQRDTQRKADMGRLSTALVNYTNSNRGTLPTSYITFSEQYLTTGGDTFIDPSGAPSGTTQTTYQFVVLDNQELTKLYSSSPNTIYYTVNYTCGATSATVTPGGSRKVAFRMVLEGGGYNCVNN